MHETEKPAAPGVSDAASAVSAALAAEPLVAAAYVFGSVARGESTPLSDLDLAILVAADTPEPERAALQRRLLVAIARRLPGRRVDVRLFDELPIAIRGRVLQEGRRVLDRDRALRVREEVRTRMAYHDFLQFERAALAEGLAGLRRKVGGG